MSKTLLAIVGILMALVGVAGFTASWVDQPAWYSIVQIVVGAIAIVASVANKKD